MPDGRIEQIRQLLPRAMLADWVRLGSRLVRLLRDRRHPGEHGAILDRLLTQAQASVALRERRALHRPNPTYPPELPIVARKAEIIATLRSNQVLIVAGETGSGKTTQLPKMCLEAGLGIEARIGCTQPRRVAALSISRRIAEELQVEWGRGVGCKIRFDDHSSPETYIKVMTDGILLAEAQGDPLLSHYNALIIDEAHERSLNIDFLLGYLKGLLSKRPELKLLITSATIDTANFSRAFNAAPVIEVSGRLFPVQVEYAPFDPISEERGDLTYVDAAVQSATQVLRSSVQGDVLVFMPSERDIRETCDQLKTRCSTEAEIIPLFGRLSSGEQQRVFAACSKRKLVVATNIAETSLTIPGIRYVIDTGLARISRYNPRTRTKRLPIEPIARSSADQRKGRSGRVQDGICIRLYSEEDFGGRPLFTQPEIQRANLAEVILRLKAFRLGEIESFPFIDAPTPAAIQAGYRLLQELGALDTARALTPLGRDLAHLPIDPTLGRMLWQAQHEHASRELLIIASGLSIQDPRERPLDQKDAATTAHKRFAHPESDFLTLLNIWDAVHEEWETLPTQSQRRKFCKRNFLSYVRMREWQDLYAQLHGALEELGMLKAKEGHADYNSIHRCIFSGLLGHVGFRTERNVYKLGGNRQAKLFPGSALYAQRSKHEPGKKRQPEKPGPVTSNQPDWVVAGELVETSELFIRTIAGIDPSWILELGAHLCRVAVENPRWNAEAGRVLADERTTFNGLEVRRRAVAYGNFDPVEATRIFIRSALVEEEPSSTEETSAVSGQKGPTRGESVGPRYEFLEHNRRLREKIQICQTRMRLNDLVDLDESFFKFYESRIRGVSSFDELNRFLRDDQNRQALLATQADIIGHQNLTFDAEAFPDSVTLAGGTAPVSYAYQPGEEMDGVTVRLDLRSAQSVSPAVLQWAIPGLREAQVTELLRALPKTLRRQLMPLAPKVEEIVCELRPGGKSLTDELAEFILRRYGVAIPPGSWSQQSLPQHVRPRIEVVDGAGKVLASGRALEQLHQKLGAVTAESAGDSPAWFALARQWERFDLTGWTFGDLPEQVSITDAAGRQITAWPTLQVEEGRVHLRVFSHAEAARKAGLHGVRRLMELELQRDLGWLQKDLRALSRLDPLLLGFVELEELQVDAYRNLQEHLWPHELFPSLSERLFRAGVDKARSQLPGLAMQLLEQLEAILKLRVEILRRYGPARNPQAIRTAAKALTDLPSLATVPNLQKRTLAQAELEVLLPANFLRTTPFKQLSQLPRFLKALLVRSERAALNPLKDQERARQLAPYVAAREQHRVEPSPSAERRRLCEEYRWMQEEFKVSLFAQELGTAFPISAKRLSEQLERIGKAAF